MADIYGSNWADYLDGTDYADNIYAEAGDDSVYAYDGDDYIDAWTGDDYVDGGAGADTFVLGDSWGAFYAESGFSDYVTIKDFDWAEGDKIQVYGSIDDYSLSEYNGGMDIYYQGDLIGYVENTTNVIASADFEFV